jgi:hypothetical protein
MAAKTVKTIKHIIRLQGFDLDNGKISFSLLAKLNDRLIRLSESTLLSFVEGNSTIKRGRQADWLSRSLDFQLSGIEQGSTILEIQAPVLKDTIPSMQIPMFGDQTVEDVVKNSALGLGIVAFNQALSGKLDSSLLDKNLLKEMREFGGLLNNAGSSIEFGVDKKGKLLKLKKESIEKIKSIEEKTPASIKTKVTGVLDMLKNSNQQLEIIAGEKRIRAILSDKLGMDKLKDFFGSHVTVTGTAHYNPLGHITSLEITKFEKADKKETYFEQLPKPLFEETDLKRVAEQQRYKGYSPEKVKKITTGLDVDESLEELLAALK